jgi:hypothetical protein
LRRSRPYSDVIVYSVLSISYILFVRSDFKALCETDSFISYLSYDNSICIFRFKFIASSICCLRVCTSSLLFTNFSITPCFFISNLFFCLSFFYSLSFCFSFSSSFLNLMENNCLSSSCLFLCYYWFYFCFKSSSICL